MSKYEKSSVDGVDSRIGRGQRLVGVQRNAPSGGGGSGRRRRKQRLTAVRTGTVLRMRSTVYIFNEKEERR